MPFFKHNDVEWFYTDEGSRLPALLLLHGWCADSHDWSFQIPCLLQHGFRVIALDHRGHGRSSAPHGGRASEIYEPYAMAGDAAALLDHLMTRRALLIAHAMG